MLKSIHVAVIENRTNNVVPVPIGEVRVSRHNPYDSCFFSKCVEAVTLHEEQMRIKLDEECKKLW